MLRLYSADASGNGLPRYLIRRDGVALLPVMTADEMKALATDRRVDEGLRSFISEMVVQ